MNRRIKRLFFLLEVAGSVLVLNLAFVIAVGLRFDDLRVENPDYYNYYVQLLVFFNLLWLLLRVGRRGVEWRSSDSGLRKKVSLSLSLILAHLLAFGFLALALKDQGSYFSRLFGIYFYSCWSLLLILWNTLFHGFQIRSAKRGIGRRRIAIVGESSRIQKFLSASDDLAQSGLEISLIFSNQKLEGENEILPLESIEEKLNAEEIDEIFIATEERDQLLHWERLADQRSIRVRLLPEVGIPGERSYQLDYIGHMPVFFPRSEPLELAHNRLMKRALDIVVCLITFILVYPLFFPLISLLVLIDGKGSILFRQQRTGIMNESFEILKFRSMGKDGQVSAIGRFIRRHSLDELPQFINVFQGRMSVVGPRPHMLEHTDEYKELLDAFMLRHLIQPGLTGLAQVQGNRGSIESAEDLQARVAADVYYMENWNLLLDLKIIGLTFFQIFLPGANAK